MSFNIETDAPEAYAICRQFQLSDENIREVMNRMDKEIEVGLSKDTHARSIIKCFVTYVQDLPTGRERGKFLALDLGGTNFRVLLVTLKSETDFSMESKNFVLDKSLIVGPGQNLFDYIAECLSNFLEDQKLTNEVLPLGFTFSFPCRQVGLAKGILVTWTKGFNCPGVAGQDVVKLLQDAIERRGDIKIEIVAILNDTTGTLMSCAWKYKNCRIGLIIGTGCNACYVEKTAKAEMFDGNKSKPNMIINAEWGAFGDNGVLDFIRTEYDKEIDKQTLNLGKQLFEKCIAGMYLGEIVRKIIVSLMDKREIFVGQDSQLMRTKWKFETKFMSEIESEDSGNFKRCELVMDRFGFRNCKPKDLGCVHYICSTITERSAALVAAGLSCLTNRVRDPNISIGIDGSVYRFHPKYHDLLMKYMKKLVQPDLKFELVLSEDGSGRGAALIAAVAVSARDAKH